jgi:hypothetical protein
MNCPRCKHGSAPVQDGFYCRNCRAGFLVKGAKVATQEIFEQLGHSCRYELRRQQSPDLRVWAPVVIIILVLMVAWGNAVTGGKTPWSFGVLLAALAILTGMRAVRDEFGRVILEVHGGMLLVTQTFTLTRRHVGIEIGSIDGFWVRAEVDEDGPPGQYSLMIDQCGTRSVALLDGVTELAPLAVLAETISACIGVPSDTRGSPLT